MSWATLTTPRKHQLLHDLLHTKPRCRADRGKDAAAQRSSRPRMSSRPLTNCDPDPRCKRISLLSRAHRGSEPNNKNIEAPTRGLRCHPRHEGDLASPQTPADRFEQPTGVEEHDGSTTPEAPALRLRCFTAGSGAGATGGNSTQRANYHGCATQSLPNHSFRHKSLWPDPSANARTKACAAHAVRAGSRLCQKGAGPRSVPEIRAQFEAQTCETQLLGFTPVGLKARPDSGRRTGAKKHTRSRKRTLLHGVQERDRSALPLLRPAPLTHLMKASRPSVRARPQQTSGPSSKKSHGPGADLNDASRPSRPATSGA